MLLNIDIEAKIIGNKLLFHNLTFLVEEREKVALIGRNGVGKTTLFNLISGTDRDYEGNMQLQKGTRLVATAQEHHESGNDSVIAYVLNNLPEYQHLNHIIETYPVTMGDNTRKIQIYTDALERFSELDYYNVESRVIENLKNYQITEPMAHAPLSRLSGGQKRFVELARVEQASADLALIDEPTNHMDYAAKAAFIAWLQVTKQTVLVITHDRDVLECVDKIIEIRDGRALTFKGNYAAYLKQNASATAASMNDYEIGLKTLDNLHKQILWARSRKPSWHGTADQRNPFVVMENRLQKEHDHIQSSLIKPSFWIDRESAEGLGKKAGENYAKYKTKNIHILKTRIDTHSHELVRVEDVQLGYEGKPLFEPINFALQHGQRLQLVGRNGTGKTTLVHALVAISKEVRPNTLITGTITGDRKLRLSVYEQEIDPSLTSITLRARIERIYQELDLNITDEQVMRLMGDYLFDPRQDGELTIGRLSGGQKARLQIIKMLANNPNLLILDEPTNHLDLPSIEELENALAQYHGALLYVSHDSHFVKHIGGEQLVLKTVEVL
jgi:ATP-binding cassette subfamily F protein 3